MNAPQFDSDGYQFDIAELNGEELPDLAKIEVVPRSEAEVPSASEARHALASPPAAIPGASHSTLVE